MPAIDAPPPEAEIRAIQAGDRAAFERFVVRHQQMVCAVAYSRTGDAALSEDIAQETFLAAWRRIGSLRHAENAAAWLAAIARHKALDAVRQRQRDPLYRPAAVEAAEHRPPPRPAPADRGAMVWEALERLPVAYRETLVLHYREGCSAAETAAQLGLTEACVKKRLARGRDMIRDRIADVVEATLASTRPADAFTLGVMAAMPTAGAHAAAVTATEVAAAGSAGAMGGLAGAMLGMTGGFLGMWASIRNTPTLRARRYTLKFSAYVYASVWTLLGFQAALGAAPGLDAAYANGAIAGGLAVYAVGLFALIIACNRALDRIVREDAGPDAPPPEALENSPLSMRRLRRALRWSLAWAILASAPMAFWLETLPDAGYGGLGALFIGACHFAFWKLHRHGAAISADEVVFAETAPAGGAESWLRPRAVPPSPRARFWNQLGSMLGCIWGPTAWIIATPAALGQPGLAAAIAGNCLAASWLYAWFLRRSERPIGAMAGVLVYIGLFDAAILAIYAPGWLESGMLGPGTDAPWLYGWAGAALYAAIYAGLAASTRFLPRWD